MRVEIAVLRRCTWQGDLRQTMAAMTTGSGTSLVPGVRRLSWLMGGGSAVECGPAKGILGREMGGGLPVGWDCSKLRLRLSHSESRLHGHRAEFLKQPPTGRPFFREA